jgi:DNA-binding Lrp family transcriptional regulator
MEPVTLDKTDRLILKALQGDLDASPEPYARMADELGITEEETLSRIRKLKELGVIRRIGAMIRHIEAGIEFNGMVVWAVDPDRTQEVGSRLASFPEVTHCYERPPFGRNGGTLFTMVHASSEDACLEVVARMAQEVGCSTYEILFSAKELKKTSMTYFGEETKE